MNALLFDYLYRLKNGCHNLWINSQRRKFSQIDSILEFEKFEKEVRLLLAKNKQLYDKRLSAECIHYGHFDALLNYAGISKATSPINIYIEHGVNFSVAEVNTVAINNSVALFFQSDYKEKQIHSIDISVPVFPIGPYVYYAEPYYDYQKFQIIKKDFGKTAVVYFSHTYEQSTIHRNNDIYIEKIINPLQEEYDTILVCVYWHDIQEAFYEKISHCPKVKLISAGLRFDYSFISRTKSILELADVVVGNDVGSFVGYAICLGKPVHIIDCNERLKDRLSDEKQDERMIANKNRVADALCSNDPERIRLVYNEFWGGTYIRSKEEMRDILTKVIRVREASHYRKELFRKKWVELKQKLSSSKEKENAHQNKRT